ncbi:hypothetical protein JK358_22710 [Nocardia sp. 2]|uniref:Lipoprotein n=1 Tax=Nocardia acididurans TaxID=2802282 RepID=A0ABS1MAP3_9NOCA|nr:hypothetical protein [Nocardia acididurans]MBL1077215.1 hypothetical protein [Nocardia acididurans]
MRRGRGLRVLACLVVLGATSGCVGAVDRADFEHEIRTRGGGLVSELPRAAITALSDRIGATDLEANLILLTAPNSTQFRLVLNNQPDQVTRFLSGGDPLTAREPTVRLRVRPPDRSRQLDDYSFTLGDLGSPRPVRVSALDDLDGENFAVSEVPGLSRIEDIVDTALARSEIPDGQVTVLVVSRFEREIRIVANIVSPRSEVVAEFDRTGAFLRAQQV